MRLSANQQPEIVGWSFGKFIKAATLPHKTIAKAVVRAPKAAVKWGIPKRHPIQRPNNPKAQALQAYKALLSKVNQLGNKVSGAWITVIPFLNQLEPLWGQIHALKANITQAQYNAAAADIVAIREKGAKVYASDAGAHTGVMLKWSTSDDFAGLSEAVTRYHKWVTFMSQNWLGTQQTPYTKDLPTAANAFHKMHAAWEKMHAHFLQLQGQMQQRQANVATYQSELMDQLGLPENADVNMVMQTFTSKYADTDKKVKAYSDYLTGLGLSIQSPMGDQIGPMVEYIKSVKKKTFRNIAIGVGVVGAGAAALALT